MEAAVMGGNASARMHVLDDGSVRMATSTPHASEHDVPNISDASYYDGGVSKKRSQKFQAIYQIINNAGQSALARRAPSGRTGRLWQLGARGNLRKPLFIVEPPTKPLLPPLCWQLHIRPWQTLSPCLPSPSSSLNARQTLHERATPAHREHHFPDIIPPAQPRNPSLLDLQHGDNAKPALGDIVAAPLEQELPRRPGRA